MCKILTSIIAERSYNFLDKNDLFPAGQKGCRREATDAKTSFSSIKPYWKRLNRRGRTYPQPG